MKYLQFGFYFILSALVVFILLLWSFTMNKRRHVEKNRAKDMWCYRALVCEFGNVFNRNASTKDTIPPGAHCLTCGCMAWVDVDPPSDPNGKGYCSA